MEKRENDRSTELSLDQEKGRGSMEGSAEQLVGTTNDTGTLDRTTGDRDIGVLERE